MRRVINKVFLGSYDDSLNEEELSILGIRAVLNVSHWQDSPHYKTINLFKVGLFEDDRDQNPVLFAPVLLEQIVQEYGSVLVCCHGGVNRSPLVVSMWLRMYQNCSWNGACTATRVGLRPWMDKWIEKMEVSIS